MIRKTIHFVYETIGHMMACACAVYFCLRDFLFPPKEKAVLFVAHPDDDALFFHSYIKEYKPYVVLLTTGGLIRRVLPFYKAMRAYGVRCRAFDMSSRAVEKEELIRKRIAHILNHGRFSVCATHNAEGEYGHIMHQCIHRCVRCLWKSELLVPVCRADIEKHPLPEDAANEKISFLQMYYRGEYPTLCTFSTWIVNEKLTMEIAP